MLENLTLPLKKRWLYTKELLNGSYSKQFFLDYKNIKKQMNEEDKVQASLFSIVSHRLANHLSKQKSNQSLVSSRQISEYCKIMTGIEIHPSSEVGHGVVFYPYGGTVIGETSVIGSNSIIHEGAILGAKWVGSHQQKSRRRHPKLGSFSVIGSYAQVIGALELPPGFKLEPYGRITEK